MLGLSNRTAFKGMGPLGAQQEAGLGPNHCHTFSNGRWDQGGKECYQGPKEWQPPHLRSAYPHAYSGYACVSCVCGPRAAAAGGHQRRRAAREARRLCGSGAGMSCSSSREVRPVGHRKPMPSAVVRWKEMACSSSSVSERVLLSLFSVRDLMLEAISTISLHVYLVVCLDAKTLGPPRFY